MTIAEEMFDYIITEEDLHFCSSTAKTCQFCGKKKLKWNQVEGKWKLHEKSGKVHVCKEKALLKPLPVARVLVKLAKLTKLTKLTK